MLIEDGVLGALPLSYTGMLLKFFVTCAMTTSFCKAGEGYIPATRFDRVTSEL